MVNNNYLLAIIANTWEYVKNISDNWPVFSLFIIIFLVLFFPSIYFQNKWREEMLAKVKIFWVSSQFRWLISLMLLFSFFTYIQYHMYENQSKDLENTNTALSEAQNKIIAIQAEKDSLQSELDNTRKYLSLGVLDLMATNTYENRQIPLSALGIIDFRIKNKTFINCTIYGPAPIFLSGSTKFISNHMTKVHPDGAYIVIDQPILSGVLDFQDCIFIGCTFEQVSFIGSVDEINKIKAGIVFE